MDNIFIYDLKRSLQLGDVMVRLVQEKDVMGQGGWYWSVLHYGQSMNEWCVRPPFCTVRQGTTWANEMNFVMNHAPGAG